MKTIFSFIGFLFVVNMHGQCWKQVSANDSHVLAIKIDSTLWAWGNNCHSQLGDGTAIDKFYPEQIGLDKDWDKVFAGGIFSFAIKTDGTLWGWGRNSSGELGFDTNKVQNTPLLIETGPWKKLSLGEVHVLAIKADSSLWVWGNNNSGQIGNSSTIDVHEPINILPLTKWKAISAGSSLYSMAIKSDGTLWGWGDNLWGQVGSGNHVEYHIPVQIGIDSDWSNVISSTDHTFAIKTDGTLWAWGENYFGVLGSMLPSTTIPVKIGTDTSWINVASGQYHTIALKSDSTLWSWGWNNYGQLGLGNFTDYYTPQQIGNEKNWDTIFAFSNYCLGFQNNGSIWVWGQNFYGQFGTGTKDNANIPTEINCSVSTKTKNSNIENNKLSIIPNPAINQIAIEATDLDLQNMTYEIRNSLGAIVILKNSFLNYNQIDVSNLIPGIYFLIFQNNKTTITKQFVKI